MSSNARHTEWLSLVEISGPFLVPSVLNEALPQGLEAVESSRRKLLRSVYDEWSEAVDDNDPDLNVLHREFVRVVLEEFLEYENTVFKPFDGEDSSLIYKSPDADVSFAPDFVLQDDGNDKPFLLVSVHPPGTDLEKVGRNDRWPVTLFERMTLLCRSAGVRLGLITNGERWMLVNAPIESSTGHTSWYARLWLQEPVTLQAFQTVLGVRRFFGPEEERLDALLDKSLEQQEEVTNTLGEQVRRAVEVLVQALDRADQDRNRELLEGISPGELYEAGLTVMMRSVFILCAEERGLLLLGDETYDQCYAISTMRSQLAADADRYGPEVLERRHDAWSRLLAMFRAVYGGIEHEALRMPALGGSLFDPDRFPFLEGRAKDTSWKDIPARPLPIDNRTVLLLLSALQVLEQRGGALLLSYKALDVEQIGHVYEGLLEHTVKRLPDTTLGFEGTKKVWNPNITLDELETINENSVEKLVEFLHEGTGRSKTAIKNALKKKVEDATFGRVVAACSGDHELADKIKPFAHLLRADAWGDFIVYKADSYAVTSGSDRRETGTHYTPKSLTEIIVDKTLEPVAYTGPAEGKPRKEWQLKNPAKLLDLKICDPGMGSGAFLVQVCRWLSRRVVDAWGVEEANSRFVTIDGEVLGALGGQEPMPNNLDERLLIAKRLIAERCLYGVDINSLAVELAKMSIWLVTMSKGRPFGFLDHNLRSGDSLLGIHRLEQLTKLSMEPDKQEQLRIFGRNIEEAVDKSIAIRIKIREFRIRDIYDVMAMSDLYFESRKNIEAAEIVANAMVGHVLSIGDNVTQLSSALNSLSTLAHDVVAGNTTLTTQITQKTRQLLSIDVPDNKPPRTPFHWPLEFPEVFSGTCRGFDAVVGNPPFLGGKRIRGANGRTYGEYLTTKFEGTSLNADLCSFFFRRVYELIKDGHYFGLLATKTISEGATRDAGLSWLLSVGAIIYSARKSFKWPGKATVRASQVHIMKGGDWSGSVRLDDREVTGITQYLDEGTFEIDPYELDSLPALSHIGSVLYGDGFVLSPSEAQKLLKDKKADTVLKPYVNGDDINGVAPNHVQRYAIDFRAMSESAASQYHAPYMWVKEHVQAFRLSQDPKQYQQMITYWWQHWRPRKKLYGSLKGLSNIIVFALTSKYICPTFLPVGYVYDQTLVCVASEDCALFAYLQSTLHQLWAIKYGASLGETLRYNPTRCYKTFPVPENYKSLSTIGESYYLHRQSIMIDSEIGLTDVYNQFHNDKNNEESITRLRELHCELDKAVLSAFGWLDIDYSYSFRETNEGVHYTISEISKEETLKRLLKLNHSRYEETQREAVNAKNRVQTSSKRKTRQNMSKAKGLSDLFEEPGK